MPQSIHFTGSPHHILHCTASDASFKFFGTSKITLGIPTASNFTLFSSTVDKLTRIKVGYCLPVWKRPVSSLYTRNILMNSRGFIFGSFGKGSVGFSYMSLLLVICIVIQCSCIVKLIYCSAVKFLYSEYK